MSKCYFNKEHKSNSSALWKSQSNAHFQSITWIAFYNASKLQMLVESHPRGAPFITRTSIRECTTRVLIWPSILHIHMLHKFWSCRYVHMYRAPLDNVQHLYLYGRITRLYEKKLGYICFSFPYLVQVCMKMIVFKFWKGRVGWAKHVLLRIAREIVALLCGGWSKGMWEWMRLGGLTEGRWRLCVWAHCGVCEAPLSQSRTCV